MHVARIAPALQLVRPWSGAGPLFSTVLHEYFPFQYTISLIENNYWHNTVTMTIYAWPDHLTSPGPPLWCKFMWKYQDYAVTSSSKAEGGNLEQSCRLKSNLFLICIVYMKWEFSMQSLWQVWQTLFHELPSFYSQKSFGENLKPATCSSKPWLKTFACAST